MVEIETICLDIGLSLSLALKSAMFHSNQDIEEANKMEEIKYILKNYQNSRSDLNVYMSHI